MSGGLRGGGGGVYSDLGDANPPLGYGWYSLLPEISSRVTRRQELARLKEYLRTFAEWEVHFKCVCVCVRVCYLKPHIKTWAGFPEAFLTLRC